VCWLCCHCCCIFVQYQPRLHSPRSRCCTGLLGRCEEHVRHAFIAACLVRVIIIVSWHVLGHSRVLDTTAVLLWRPPYQSWRRHANMRHRFKHQLAAQLTGDPGRMAGTNLTSSWAWDQGLWRRYFQTQAPPSFSQGAQQPSTRQLSATTCTTSCDQAQLQKREAAQPLSRLCHKPGHNQRLHTVLQQLSSKPGAGSLLWSPLGPASRCCRRLEATQACDSTVCRSSIRTCCKLCHHAQRESLAGSS